ncbi:MULTISPECIES: ABC transporter ATP-binding protein [Pantoea]|uniref:ABC transporter ATP-binding protein n=1 Tax=Pantoea TaxID=53335 RepID=UPI0023B0883F|nr:MULTISPECIES: ABC transporter ATP-binding protein [Pantoea]MDE8556737.1 ABC transporter ATP-binding protein [Pantoea vagans]MDE8576743.1 ABC transporter ATP-binding protein [Pantoea vagans]GME30158.1 ABC transporter ATP-binding protein [Pantoea sp. QMID3]GME30478.1 ABC transporter ATP-binding protein [Pantoea sp. QMID1]GME50256.1 ABC transporter ATP-binding protein [Pantoea sp. QMID4]
MGSIVVSNVGKSYKKYSSRWGRLAEWFIPGVGKKHDLKWVIHDISFTVNPGEAVGIIGINGAGKSTLLKMITGTTIPSKGIINLKGRVAALLELGMGFHPDFTGRQNVFMSGQLLGYSVQELHQLMPDIESFAEIGDYIDQPVRVYSSGMQMRLAFSVATAVRPDILIVDEALSVGDSYFQHKSFDRIRDYARQGTTLLIVSHDKAAIQSICDRAILLNEGRKEFEGNPEAVMDYYNALLADKEKRSIQQKVTDDGKIQTVSGTGEANVIATEIYDKKGELSEHLNVGEDATLLIRVKVNQDLPRLVVGYSFKDRLGQVIYGTNTLLKDRVILDVKKDEIYDFEFKFSMNIGVGSYSVQTALVSSETHLVNNYEWRDLALVFNVINAHKEQFAGVAWIDPDIEIKKNEIY